MRIGINWLRIAVDSASRPRALAFCYLTLAAFVVLTLDVVLPPLVAPDEFAHLFRAASLSSGQALPAPGPDQWIGGKVDPSVVELRRLLEPFAAIKAPTPVGVAAQARRVAWTDNLIRIRYPNTGQYGPALYLPQAIGLALGRYGGLSTIKSYYFARLLNSLIVVGLASVAVAKAGRCAFVLASFLLTPMFLFLAASVSQDGLLMAISALFAAVVSKPAMRNIDPSKWMAWLCALLMVMARPPYLPLTLLLIRGRYRRTIWRWLLAVDGPLAPVLMGAISVSWLFAVGAVGQPSFAPFPRVEPSAQMASLMQDPSSILQIALGTLANGEVVTRLHEVIGVLGLLNITLPTWAYTLGILSIGLSLTSCVLQPGGSSPLRSLLAAASILLTLGAVYASVYLTWTPVGTNYVIGVQGRYLSPLFFALPLTIPFIDPAAWGGRARASARYTCFVAACGYAACGLMLVVATEALTLLHSIYGSVFVGPWFS